MVSSVAAKVSRLEATTEGGDRCPECGLGPGDDKRPWEFVFVDPDADLPPDEWCERCGRVLSLSISMDWGDSGP